MNTSISKFAATLFLASLFTASNALASDPMAELGDLYAFVDPHCQAVSGSGCEDPPDELILALTINQGATTGGEQFSEDVVYHFNLENDAGKKRQLSCVFSADQVMTCAGIGDLEASARVGQVGVNGGLRVFAGLRDDPMWFDMDAYNEFLQIGIAAYDGSGNDSLAGANVMSIVVGIDVDALPNGTTSDHNLFKVWASSERIGGDGINGSITGSWYNSDETGQGYVIEIVGTKSGGQQFLTYFYGYDDDGEQLWLISGASEIDGDTATATVYRTNGMGFGGGYDPESFELGEPVGTMVFEFSDCDNGMVSFVSDDTSVLSDFNTTIERISTISSLECGGLLTLGQVDRVGRPFTRGLISDDLIDDYRANDDPETWTEQYLAAINSALTGLSFADGVPGWGGFNTQEEWAEIFVDDRIQIDVKKAQSVGYLSIENSQLVPQDWNDSGGRALDYDVHETVFNLVITSFDPFIEDGLTGNDVPNLEDFPFLAEPH